MSLAHTSALVARGSDRSMCWQAPPPGVVKLNVDGACWGEHGLATIGGICRNTGGMWVFGFQKYVGRTRATSAEIWAIWQGLEILWSQDYRHVIMETDCQHALEWIQESTAQHPDFNVIIKIREIQRRAWSCCLQHVVREANGCADWLAKRASQGSTDLVVLDYPPLGLQAFLASDVPDRGYREFV